MNFVEVIMVSVLIRTIHPKLRQITWAIKEGKVASPTIILKVGEAIKIKILGGSKRMVHPISKGPSNGNNNPITHQFLKIPWKNS